MSHFLLRGVARGGPGARAPPPSEIVRSVNPIQTNQGVDYVPHISASPPEFKMLSTPLRSLENFALYISQAARKAVY